MRAAAPAAIFLYMLRALAILLLIATPALAWETSSNRVCTLTHEADDARIRITYDPANAEYAISITQSRPWVPGPTFAIRFDGERGMTISTNRHLILDGGTTLTVKDRGFDNVLNGLAFNDTATALLGDQAVVVALEGAGPAVRAFQVCANGVRI